MQLSSEIGYVMYSAFGSFYIPSCIMVFVYIKIYYAARERARRNINKPNIGKRISRKFANLSDKNKGGKSDKIDEANKKEALLNSSKPSVPKVQINNKSATDSTQATTTLISTENNAVTTVISNEEHKQLHDNDELQCSSLNGKNQEEVELHPILNYKKAIEQNGNENNGNSNNGILTSVSIENSESSKTGLSTTNGNASSSGLKKKMRFSDDTKGSDDDTDQNGADILSNKTNIDKIESNIEVENEGEKKSLLPMKVVRVKTDGPQPKQIHPRKKMVHIMSAYAAEEEDDSPHNSLKCGSEISCDNHQLQEDEDVILENPSATEILEVESTKLPHPYGECASAKANGVRTRRSVGVSTRTDNGCGAQTQTCSRVCRRSHTGVSNRGNKRCKSEEIVICDESNCCCKYQDRTRAGAVNHVRSLRTKLRLRFRSHTNRCEDPTSNPLTANERRSSKGKPNILHDGFILMPFYINIQNYFKSFLKITFRCQRSHRYW